MCFSVLQKKLFIVQLKPKGMDTILGDVKKLRVPPCLLSVTKIPELRCHYSGTLENFFFTKLDFGASQSEQQ